jgi:SAM-dependent methyltransferase
MPAEFDKFSDAYEDLLKDPIRDRFAASGHAFFHRRKLEILTGFLKSQGLDPSRLSLLDVGCGKGDFLKLSLSCFGQLAGCDPSEKMLRELGSKSIVLQTQQIPTKLPYQALEFEVLTAICVFHHRHARCKFPPSTTSELQGFGPSVLVALGRSFWRAPLRLSASIEVVPGQIITSRNYHTLDF